MKFKLVIFILFIIIVNLQGLTPKSYNFQNSYQFQLYNDWIQFGNFKTNAQTIISEDLFILDFAIRRSKKIISTEFDLVSYKAFRLREIIFVNEVSDFQIPNNHLKILEDFLFRLNTDHNYALLDFVDQNQINIFYQKLSDIEAIKAFFIDLEVRFEIKKIKQKQYKSSILYSLTSKKNITIQIKIPTSKNQLLIASKKLRSIKREFIQKKESPIIDKKIIEPIKEIIESDDIIQKPDEHLSQPADPPKIENLSKLEDYLYYNFSRKMLYNSVDSPQKFLLEQFPQKQITIENNSIEIAGDSFQGLGNSIFINIEYIENGIDFNTDFSYDFYNKNLVFNNFTLINNGLNKNKLLDLAPTISRLLYLHRSLGTDLVHFLTRHNQVQTKVIINHKGGKKQVVKDSYSRVLLSLNEYFKGKDVYFNFNEVTKIKGHIEILGYLVAKGENSLETADIRIHLNNKNKADLVMIFFYPNVIE